MHAESVAPAALFFAETPQNPDQTPDTSTAGTKSGDRKSPGPFKPQPKPGN
jgi:hypothetical protein